MTVRDDIGERAQARVGAVLKGKWRLDSVIGIGGMATVYAATHRNRSRCAIKMLHPEVAISQDVTARFLREGYVGNAVAHPGTVKVLDDDVTEDGAPFLVMELLEGESLGARLDRGGSFSPNEVALLADQLLDVLAAAHAAHIVHRDLKPDNVFLTLEGRVKVLDFGIARLRSLASETSSSTQAGSLLGTPAYMAPEQALGRWREVDERTDIWAVGATLFTLVTGRFVHEAEALQEQLVLAATSKAPPLASLAPHCPPWLCAIVDRALEFGRDQRFPDARSMQAALRRNAQGVEFPVHSLSLPGVAAPLSGSTSSSGVYTPRTPQALSTPSFGEGATLVASEPGVSVQAVARSAQLPAPSPRSGRWLFAIAAVLGVATLGALTMALWSRPSPTTDAGVPPLPSAVASVAAQSQPPPQPTTAVAQSSSATPPVALAKATSSAVPPVAATVKAHAESHQKPPVLPKLPPLNLPPPPAEHRENLFDSRH